MAKSPKKPEAKTPTKSAKPSPNLLGGGQPLIDTNLAARAAASMFLQKNKQGSAPSGKSSLVDQIKADLSKPATANLGEILGGSTQAASHLTGHKEFNKQTRTAQSNDAARTGVPRRNPG
jgi:hypothetical protein